MLDLKVKKLIPEAKLPTYGTSGAACFDIYSSKDVKWEKVQLDEGSAWQAVVPTGLAFEINKDFRMDIYPRSGWGFKHNIQLGNGTGKIDEDYRGELMIKLIGFCKKEELPGEKDKDGNIVISKHSRIAQGELNPVFRVNFKEVSELSDTDRGEGGFGSTGHK